MTAHLLGQSRQMPVGHLLLETRRKAVERNDIGGVRRGHVYHCLLGGSGRRVRSFAGIDVSHGIE